MRLRTGLIRRRATRRVLFVCLAAAAILAAGYAGPRLARYVRRQYKLRRIDQYNAIIWRRAQDNALPTDLVRAIILAESGGDRRAVSARGAMGLMQIMPPTEAEVLARKRIPKGDLFEADYNVLIGTSYLRMLLDRFDQDAHLAVAGYHMGPTGLDRLRRSQPHLPGRQLIESYAPASTRRYCRQVLGAP